MFWVLLGIVFVLLILVGHMLDKKRGSTAGFMMSVLCGAFLLAYIVIVPASIYNAKESVATFLSHKEYIKPCSKR